MLMYPSRNMSKPEEKNSEHSSSVVISDSDSNDVGLDAHNDSMESDELELGVSVFA